MKKQQEKESNNAKPQQMFLLQDAGKITATSQNGPALAQLQEKAKPFVRSYQYGGYNGL